MRPPVLDSARPRGQIDERITLRQAAPVRCARIPGGRQFRGSTEEAVKRLLAVLALVTFGTVGFAQVIDGVVESGEYDFDVDLGLSGFRLSWSIRGDRIHMAFAADARGWVAVGFEPTVVMDQADMLFGWVEPDGTAHVVDAMSTGEFGPHPPDTSLGGTDDILASAATERGGRTTVEVTRLLVTGDAQDKPIPRAGPLKVIFSYADSDSFSQGHSRAGTATIDLATIDLQVGVFSGLDLPIPLLSHVVLLTTAFLAMFGAVFVPRSMKRTIKSWRVTHITLELTGGMLGIVGAIIGYNMVARTTGPHLRVVHAGFALLTIAVLVATPILGQLFLSLRKGKRQLRLAHHYAGRAALTLMFCTIVLGLFQAGLI